MKLCISQATTLPAAFADDLNAFADVGWQAAELWLTKLEKHLEATSLDEVRRLLRDRGLSSPPRPIKGGLLLTQGEERRLHFEHFRRRLELCDRSASRLCC